jgi:L-threonylcarbamoyladenylate synthase
MTAAAVPFTLPSHLPAAVAAVREALSRHGVIALPTETFYGLAVDPYDETAVARVFAIKGRDAAKALLVVVADVAQAEGVAALDEVRRAALAALWPAPLTVVLPARRPLAAAGATVAVRVPAHPLLRSLLARVGPLTATSANRGGAPPCAAATAVRDALADDVDLILDGGPTAGGSPSTLVDWTGDRPLLLRPGAFAVPPSWR